MRPPFIPRDAFRVYMKPQHLNRYLVVDGILASSYVDRCKRKGRPIASAMSQGVHCYRLIDVVARAQADAVELADPTAPDVLTELANARQQLKVTQTLLADLEERIEECRHRLEVVTAANRISMATLLQEDEIVDAAEPMPPLCGVYFLVRGREVVYVGQSVNIVARVAQHTDKKFDSVAYLPCTRDELDVLESMYIHTLRPPLNGRVGGRGKIPSAPLSMEQLMKRVVGAAACA